MSRDDGLFSFLIPLSFFIIGAFATYYIALVVSQEEGPFGLFAYLRRKAQERPGWVARGIVCIVCVSSYSGLLIALLLVDVADWQTFIVVWLGLAGTSVTIDRWWKRG